MTCDFCGSEENVSQLGFLSGQPCICSECVKRAHICSKCGEVIIGEYNPEGCKHCLIPCSECGNIGAKYRKITGTVLCKSCHAAYKKCPTCDKLHKTNRTARTLAGWEHIGVTVHHCADCFAKMKKNKKPKKVLQCGHCGEWTSKTKYGSPYCDTCQREVIIKKCSHCGLGHHHYRNTPSSVVCVRCIDKYYTLCRMCNHYHLNSDMEGKYCKTCRENAKECTVCGSLTVSPFSAMGETLCEVCQRHVRNCRECKTYTWASETGYCNKCIKEYGVYAMENWKYRPRKFNFQGKGPMFYGIENEFSVQDITGFGEAISRTFSRDLLYYQFDGSIEPRHHGLEVVLHPLDFKSIYEQNLEELFKLDVHHLHVPNTSCGMHVHMTKDMFSRFHLLKFMYFFYENPEFISKIAERGVTHYCRPDKDRKALIRKAKLKGSDERYQAVNLEPKETVEVRIFQAATTIEQFYKNVEFCDALYHYTKKEKKRDMSVRKFKAYVTESKAKYKYLYNFIQTI